MAVQSKQPDSPQKADTAGEPKKRAGRPKGSYDPRILTFKFPIVEAIVLFTELQTRGEHPQWAWDGKLYLKRARNNGPDRDSLELHGYVLKTLFMRIARP